MEKTKLISYLKQRKEFIIAFVISAITAFFFLVNSPLHPWRGSVTGTDSSVFKTIALMMEKGYMPYRDSFDHKGPLLYAINWMGNQIGYYRGVWVFEFVFMTITFFLFYKIARLATKIIPSIIVAFTAISMLFNYFEAGNMTEEYAMMFIAIGVYIFLDYLLKDRISPLRIAISGVAMGGVCLLRPNMIAVWLSFCIAIFLLKIKEKNWKQLREFVIFFIVGVSCIILPFVIWLGINGALDSCIKDYIIFNKQYTSAEGGMALFSAKWNSFFYFASSTVYAISLISLFYNIKKKVFLNVTYVVYMVMNLLFICMSGMTFGHYGMVLIPAVVYPLSLIFNNVEQLSNEEVTKTAKMLIGMYALSAIIIPSVIDTIKMIPIYYEQKDNEQFDDVTKSVCDTVTSLTDENDKISVYGNWDIVYVKTKREHATKYSYQFPIGQVMPDIMAQYMEQLQEELPVMIVVEAGRYDENIDSFLKNNAYNIVWPQIDEVDYSQTTVYYRSEDADS